jgi:hypothetical protein
MGKEKLDKKTWTALRKRLNGAYDYTNEWEKVIVLFKQRIDNFYFDPIDLILAPQSKRGEGFAIITLQCALIEMFSAFKSGMIYEPNRKSIQFSFQYSSSKQIFVKFLHEELIFQTQFFSMEKNGKKSLDTPFNANEFYERVRCGLMHEARTKGDWRITANPSRLSTNGFIGIDNADGSKVVHRSKLNEKLKSYFNDVYLSNLRGANVEGNKLRRFLGRKLDNLHSLPIDPSYDWWKEP